MRAWLEPIPRPALQLGLAGLIPFLALSLWLVGADPVTATTVRPLLLGYAIAILSFMGGVHWGLSMRADDTSTDADAWRRFGVSVVPALAAWAALFLPKSLQFIWLGICFAALLYYDLHAVRRGEAVDWYRNLRWPLTLVVVVCLVLAATADAF